MFSGFNVIFLKLTKIRALSFVTQLAQAYAHAISKYAMFVQKTMILLHNENQSYSMKYS